MLRIAVKLVNDKVIVAKHTPGPWKITQESIDPEWHIITAARGRVVANVHIETGNKMGEANARLMVAAPELLAYAECEEARRVALLPPNAGGTGNSQSYMEVFTRHGFRTDGRQETVFQFLDRLRLTAITKATGGDH